MQWDEGLKKTDRSVTGMLSSGFSIRLRMSAFLCVLKGTIGGNVQAFVRLSPGSARSLATVGSVSPIATLLSAHLNSQTPGSFGKPILLRGDQA